MTTQRDGEATNLQPPPMDRDRAPAHWPGWLAATAQAIRFYSRLPVPLMPGETEQHAAPDFRVMPRALPLAALVIAIPAVLVAAAAQALELSSLISAALILTTLTITSGAFHEDGLADTADGLFGGHTIERRLAIMKDSLIGSFGASALVLAFLLRFAGLVAILDGADIAGVCAAIAIATIWSRSLGIHLLAVDAPARAYGALATVGMPTVRTAVMTLVLAATLCAASAWAGGLPLAGLINALALATFVALGLAALARRLIGGPTGDIAGAAQQLGEIAAYLGLAVALA